MAAFDYIALDAKGKELKGIVEGDGAKQVRQVLRDKGLMPLEITESRKAAQGKQDGGKGWMKRFQLLRIKLTNQESKVCCTRFVLVCSKATL